MCALPGRLALQRMCDRRVAFIVLHGFRAISAVGLDTRTPTTRRPAGWRSSHAHRCYRSVAHPGRRPPPP